MPDFEPYTTIIKTVGGWLPILVEEPESWIAYPVAFYSEEHAESTARDWAENEECNHKPKQEN